MTEWKLKERIVEKSEAKDFFIARDEWELDYIVEADHDAPERCLCTHYPIIELCNLRNHRNGNEVVVGNCCVKQFLGLPSDKIFQCIKRLRDDIHKSMNSDLLHYAYDDRKWLTQWEYYFAVDTMAKRKLSRKQLDVRERINSMVLKMLDLDNMRWRVTHRVA